MRPLVQSEAAMTIAAPLAVGVVIVVLWEIGCRELRTCRSFCSPSRATSP